MSEFPHVRESESGDIIPHDDNPVDFEVTYQSPDETEYMMTIAGAAGAAQSLIGAEVETKEASEADLAERMTTVEERFGFIPRSRRELSDTYDLTGKDLVGGAATHLNTVLQRQKRYDVEAPDATVRSIVARYAGYAENAKVEYGLLSQLEEIVVDESGSTTLNRLGTDWKYSGALSRPLLHGLWTQDAHAYMRDAEGVDPLKQLDAGEKYSASNKATLEAIQQQIDVTKPAEFIDALSSSKHSEVSRYEFWVNALQEARNHKAGAAVAYEALKKLRVIKEDS